MDGLGAISLTPDDVVVTASRYGTDVHLSHTNLTTAEIRRRQSARDIPMLLEDIPGVYSYSDAGNGIGYTYLKIRGFDQRRVGGDLAPRLSAILADAHLALSFLYPGIQYRHRLCTAG